MNDLEKIVFVDFIRKSCSEDPSLVKDVIDAATCGVKQFAENQSDKVCKMAFKMFSVLNSTDPKHLKFGTFTPESVVRELELTFLGTKGLEDLKNKLGIKNEKET